jgi:hypothetical protein
VPRRQRRGSNRDIEFAAAPSNDSLILEVQVQAAKSNFKSGGTFVIINEQIGHSQRKRIQRTTCRNAELAKAGAAKILHRGKKARSSYNHLHGSP